MIFEKQKYEITRWDPEKDLDEISRAARMCYKSKNLKTRAEKEKFIRDLRDRDSKHPHLSPFEHSILSVEFVTNRGVTHELVRHRIASFNQESTRYCNYSKNKFDSNVHFIIDTSVPVSDVANWMKDCQLCEERYFRRLKSGCTPDKARGALNNDVKSEIKITTNYREWRHIFNLRCDDVHAHYQMVELMSPLLREVREEIPCIFDDIEYE